MTVTMLVIFQDEHLLDLNFLEKPCYNVYDTMKYDTPGF